MMKEGPDIKTTALKMIQQDLAKPLDHDLDDLFGIWSQAEAAEFNRWLNKERTIDPELWK